MTQAEAAKGEAKPEPDATAPQTVTLRVRQGDGEGREMLFKVKPTMAMRKLMDTWAKKMGRDRSSLRFIYDGKHLDDNSTVAGLQMAEGDTIEVFQEQLGGAN